ncbi:hypothetical protein [Albimonas donghaensis]|nr:hypothetical protein [Albimonas donghaensis]
MPPRPALSTLILGGIAGEIAFEAYAWLLSPRLFGVTLEPANLIVGLARTLFGLDLGYWTAFGLHFAIGAVAFSAVVTLVHMATRTSLPLAGAIAGVLLWFVAQGLLAPAMGRSFMMGFGAYTQSSFIAHVGMSVIIGLTMAGLSRARRAPAPT